MGLCRHGIWGSSMNSGCEACVEGRKALWRYGLTEGEWRKMHVIVFAVGVAVGVVGSEMKGLRAHFGNGGQTQECFDLNSGAII